MRSIVINREFGSGGREVGRLVAEQAHLPFYDSRIIQDAAAAKGLSADLLARFDERIASNPFAAISMFAGGDPEAESLPYRLYSAIQDVVVAAALTAPAVFVGRCADKILADAKIPFRSVFVYSTDLERKIARAVDVDGVPRKSAESYIATMDRTRSRYQQFFTDTKFGDHREYDVCLNSARLSYAECARVILATVA
jgi:cytidylate kinase